MKPFAAVTIFLLCLLQLTSCGSHQVFLLKTQTPLNYSDKVQMKIGVYFAPEFTKYEMTVPVLGEYCKESTFPIPSLGHGFADAVYEGTKTAVRDIAVLKSVSDTTLMDSAKVKYMIVPKIDSASGNIKYAQGTFANMIQAAFKGALSIDIKARNGKTLYHFAINRNNVSNGSGDCLDGSEVIGRAVDIVLQDIAEDIARTLHDSEDVAKVLK